MKRLLLLLLSICVLTLSGCGLLYESSSQNSSSSSGMKTTTPPEKTAKFELLFHNLTDYPISSYFEYIAVNGIMVVNMDTWGDGAFAQGWCYTGAEAGNTYTIWSALEDEIEERGFDNVTSINGTKKGKLLR